MVNDGCTDSTLEILNKYPQLTITTHTVNKGKGKALRDGFAQALEKGFEYVISIDSDGHRNLNEMKSHPRGIRERLLARQKIPS